MSANAGELCNIMKVRLKMQEQGITNPSASVKAATKQLVEKLGCIPASESIEIIICNKSTAKYIRTVTGEILVEINEA